jgi:putative transcriptional regulator
MAGDEPREPKKGQNPPTGSHTRKKPRAIEGENFLEGKILIALPGMPDPRFEKTIIYMCAHSGEGAMGIIVNKPVEGLSFSDLMKKLEVQVTGKTPDMPVLYGGPMETGRGFVLHSGEYESADATLPVAEDVSLTTTIEILRAMSEGRGPQKAIFALGYAGWSPGQIENELRGNGWIHCDADSSLLFGGQFESKWAMALKKLGIDASGLSAHAGRA